MSKAFSAKEVDALNEAVRGVVEQAISSLQAIGLAQQDAVALLLVQSAIRMNDTTEVRSLLHRLGG